MNTAGGNARQRERWMKRLGSIVALVFALMLASMVATFTYSAEVPDTAYAAIYTANDEEQADDQQQQATAGDEAAAAEGEQIDDEENPMSSGLGGGEPVATNGGMGMGIMIAVIAGIVAVVIYFGVTTGRLNSSIKKMNNTFK